MKANVTLFKKVAMAMVVAMALAMALALVGCGGGSSDPVKAFSGTWKITNVESHSADLVVTHDYAQKIQEAGYKYEFQLNEDGTGTFFAADDEVACTWEAESANAGSITYNGETMSMSLSGKVMTIDSSEVTYTLEKA